MRRLKIWITLSVQTTSCSPNGRGSVFREYSISPPRYLAWIFRLISVVPKSWFRTGLRICQCSAFVGSFLPPLSATPRLALKATWTFLSPPRFSSIFMRATSCSSNCCESFQKSTWRSPLDILAGDTGEHVVVAGRRVVPQVAIGQEEGLAVVLLVPGPLGQPGQTLLPLLVGFEPGDDVHERPPRADGGQLVRVADQDQAAHFVQIECPEQHPEQVHRDHRRLVDDDGRGRRTVRRPGA